MRSRSGALPRIAAGCDTMVALVDGKNDDGPRREPRAIASASTAVGA